MSKLKIWLVLVAVLLLAYPCGAAQEPNRSPLSNVDAPARDNAGTAPFDQVRPVPIPAKSTRRAECDEPAVLDAKGAPIFPAGAVDIEEPVVVDENRGLLSTLYPSLDTTTDQFYPLPCEPSIGGILPAAVNAPPSQDELDAERYLNAFETTTVKGIVDQLKLDTMRDLGLPRIDEFKVGGCFIKYQWTAESFTNYGVPCDYEGFLRSDQPFEGRDVIFVHGLAKEHLAKWLVNDPGARTLWRGPQDPGAAQYLDNSGYFRKYARGYWNDHVREHLFDPDNPSSGIAGWEWLPSQPSPIYRPKSNRYLLVAWSANQTIEYAQHALLTQIQLAITTNKNVVTPPNYPSNFIRPFCSNGCIVIGHSTGPLVVSSAMGLAKAGIFGPGAKQIPDYIRAHVSFSGAISGSRIATIGMAVGLQQTPAPPLVCDLINDVLNLPCINMSFLAHSILRDLIPQVAQGIWGLWVATTPIPTVTVAGGHPIGLGLGALRHLLPGLDDGVVTMNSACGNPHPVAPVVLAASGATVTSLLKAFDFSDNGGKLVRAVQNFLSHKNLKAPAPNPLFLASACTPYRSPTGMVMPILSPGIGGPWDARTRYPNHYSFIQASLSHSYDGGSEAGAFPISNPWPSSMLLPANVPRHYLDYATIATSNVEETSAITDSAIYAAAADGTHLVKPTFANEMHEIVKGLPIGFKIPYPLPYNSNKCPGRRCTWWIWKRTYHLLDAEKYKQSSHYVYEFVGRR